MSDLNTLLSAEKAARVDHHWSVAFTVRVHESLIPTLNQKQPTCDDCGQVHDDVSTIGDTVTVGCGDNGEDAVSLVKQHIVSPDYGIRIEPSTFKLQGLKLVSVREI